MASIAAKQVAQEVLETLGKGEKPNLGKIARRKGYSDNTADNPKNITETKSYKEEVRPLVEQLEAERQAVVTRLMVVRDKASYRDLIDGLDKITKNIQLLTGRATENIGMGVLSDEDKSKLDALLNAE